MAIKYLPLPHRHALENAAQENSDFDNISVYVAKDCTSEYKRRASPLSNL